MKSEPVRGGQYVGVFFSTLIILSVFLAGFNFLVDPYLTFGRPLIPGFNAFKPQLATNELMVKTSAVSAFHPAGLIVGMSTSRAIDPHHEAWQKQKMLNMGIGATTAYQWLRLIQQASTSTDLKTVFLAANFVAFNGAYEINSRKEDGFGEDNLRIDANGHLRWGLFFPALLTASATASSIDSVQKSRLALTENLLQQTIDLTFPPVRKHEITNDAEFKKTEVGLTRKHLMIDEKPFTFENVTGGPSSPESFAKIVEFCRAKNIALNIEIDPLHARTLRLINSLKLWPTFEDWKRRMVRTVVSDNEAHPGARPVKIRDFSVFSPYSEELVPAGSTAGRMKYWNEGLHYSTELADIIVDLSAGPASGHPLTPGSFGMLLEASNIEEHLMAVRRRL